MLASSLDCVVAMDHAGCVLEFNPAAERTFGYTRSEAVGAELGDLIVPEHLRDAHRRGLARYVETRQGTLLDQPRRADRHALRRERVPGRAHDHADRGRRAARVHRLHPRHQRAPCRRAQQRRAVRGRARARRCENPRGGDAAPAAGARREHGLGARGRLAGGRAGRRAALHVAVADGRDRGGRVPRAQHLARGRAGHRARSAASGARASRRAARTRRSSRTTRAPRRRHAKGCAARSGCRSAAAPRCSA